MTSEPHHRPRSRRTARGAAVAAVALLLGATACLPAPPPGTSHSPSGYFDHLGFPARPDPVVHPVTLFRAEGWTSDWDTTAPIKVMVAAIRTGHPMRWVHGWPFDTPEVHGDTSKATFAFDADGSRPDVHAAFGRGDRFGFDVVVEVPYGTELVCVVALNVGPGDHTILGCTPPPPSPPP